VKPDMLTFGERYRELGARLSRRQTEGPYLFCDYWASVLSLRRILNPAVLRDRLISLDVFRRALDRPKTRLPRLRYYILAFMLGPGFLPYRLAFNLAMLVKPKSREKIVGRADFLLDDYRLQLRPEEDPRWVRARLGTTEIEEPILNPEFASVESENFFSTYKLLLAATITVLVSLVLVPALKGVNELENVLPYFGPLFYPVLVVVLHLLLRDLLTSVLAPLPVFAVKGLLGMTESFWGFVAGMVGAGLLFYFVEWFMIPRGLPPTLYLYVNQPEHRFHPYGEGHAPYWLTGRYYWVWRFVTLAPAEINKFWEKDWERVEFWVRADQGPDAGRLEWMVTDAHYRELWFRYDRLVSARARGAQQGLHRRLLHEEEKPVVWIVETDMNLISHTPEFRTVFLSTPEPPLRDRSLVRILRTMVSPRVRDDARLYEEEIERIEVTAGEFLSDLPEHLRGFIARHIFKQPWSYWRYPKGVRSSPRIYVYSGEARSAAPLAADPRYQIKAYKEELFHGGDLPSRTPPSVEARR
jgi:hypothetical protein